MKITMAFASNLNSSDAPDLISAYDEYASSEPVDQNEG